AVRLLGLGLSNLEEVGPQQLLLFDDAERPHAAMSALDTALDSIRQQFGSAALRRATLVRHKTELKRGP
ncbi:MAG: hypothetical protein KDA45_13730, partial [Planctomycetales bacterium]|nr:hypothetical protein [Planctomycetales bacterium]